MHFELKMKVYYQCEDMASAFRESEEKVPRLQGRDKVGFPGNIKDNAAEMWQDKKRGRRNGCKVVTDRSGGPCGPWRSFGFYSQCSGHLFRRVECYGNSN